MFIVCLSSCNTYHHVTTSICSSYCYATNLKEAPQSPTDLWQLLPTIYSTYRPFIITTYYLQCIFSYFSPLSVMSHTHFPPKRILLTASSLESYKIMIHNPLPQRINKEPKKNIHHTKVESFKIFFFLSF